MQKWYYWFRKKTDFDNKLVTINKKVISLTLDNSNKTNKCLFGTVKLTRIAEKSNFIYDDWQIAFNKAGSWSFSYDFNENVTITHMNNSSSSHTDYQNTIC